MLAFGGRGKLEYPGKTSQNKVKNQQTQSKYDRLGSGNQTQTMLVEGKCFHHCAKPALNKEFLKLFFKPNIFVECNHATLSSGGGTSGQF